MKETMKKSTMLVLESPGGKLFLKLPIVGVDCDEEYFKIIQRPISLEMVLRRIDRDEYQNYHIWIEDVELIWKNCEIYYGIDSYEFYIAKALKTRFIKICHHNHIFTFGDYCNEIHRLQSKIGKLLLSSPFICGGRLEISLNKSVSKQLQNEEDFERIIVGMSMLSDQKDIDDSVELIVAKQPEIVNFHNKSIDVTKLLPSTYLLLKDSISKALSKQGLSFPK